MSTVLDQLDKLDSLVVAARKSRIQPDKVVAGMLDAMQKIQAQLVQNPSAAFLDADAALSEALDDHEKHPELAGVAKIGKALVRYRTAATS